MEKRILKNSVGLFLAQSFIKLISFGYAIFLARSLGVNNFGYYAAAMAYFALFTSIADFGFNRFLIREGAKDKSKLVEFLYSTVFTRFLITSVSFLIFSLVLSHTDNNGYRILLAILAVFAVIPESVAFSFDAALTAQEKFRFSAIASFVLSIMNTILGIVLVSLGYGAAGAIVALIIGYILYSFSLFIFTRSLKAPKSISRQNIKALLLGSLPYGILGVLGLIYFRIDTLMLSYMTNSVQTGLYGAAYKFLEAITFIPTTISAVMFPVLSRLHQDDTAQLKRLYYKSVITLVGFSLVLLLGYLFVLPFILQWALPQYLGSIQAIIILAFTLPFMFAHVPGTLVLFSSDKYLKPVIYVSVFMVLLNIVLNYLVIPVYGYIGTSVVTVISEAVTFISFFIFLQLKVFRHE